MVRLVKREYLVDLVEQYYKERECYFCGDSNCNFCKKKQRFLNKNLEKKIILVILMLLFGKYHTTKMTKYSDYFSRTLK